jgi:hypothetical protein
VVAAFDLCIGSIERVAENPDCYIKPINELTFFLEGVAAEALDHTMDLENVDCLKRADKAVLTSLGPVTQIRSTSIDQIISNQSSVD